jgi:hypothetical protein
VLLTASGPGTVFAGSAGLAAAAALLVLPIQSPPAFAAEEGGPSLAAEATAGFRAVGHHPGARVVVALLGVQCVIWGALDILFVVLALDVLHVGAGWVGYFNAAFAAGAVLGTSLAVLLVGRRRLAPPIITTMLVWGAAFVLIAATRNATVALVLLVLGGTSRAVFDVAARTLLQRVTPADVLGRVFGVLEGIENAALAVGALTVPPLIGVGGSTAAFVGVGLLLPLAAALLAAPLVRTDAGARVPLVEIALLRSMPLFAPLSAPAVEGVAHALEPVTADAGTVIIHQGDQYDRFYVIADGEVDVTHDNHHVARLGRPHGFGEIALLHQVPRTATVTAATNLRLYALDGEPFLTAVTGHASAARALERLATQRKSELIALDNQPTS